MLRKAGGVHRHSIAIASDNARQLRVIVRVVEWLSEWWGTYHSFNDRASLDRQAGNFTTSIPHKCMYCVCPSQCSFTGMEMAGE